MVEDGLDDGDAACAAGAGFGAGFDFTEGLAFPALDGIGNILLGDIVAGADLGVVIAGKVR